MNIQQKLNKEKGFTIIEVVLVLAIAGLIFLMVFIALPALQRNQRDTQRKNDLSRAMTAVNNYQSNNRGSLPDDGEWDEFATQYLRVGGDTFTDPNGTDYHFDVGGTPPPAFTGDGAVYVTERATCNGESVTTGQGANKMALRIKLEGGGVACDSN